MMKQKENLSFDIHFHQVFISNWEEECLMLSNFTAGMKLQWIFLKVLSPGKHRQWPTLCSQNEEVDTSTETQRRKEWAEGMLPAQVNSRDENFGMCGIVLFARS